MIKKFRKIKKEIRFYQYNKVKIGENEPIQSKIFDIYHLN
jgi:hypothetical protein